MLSTKAVARVPRSIRQVQAVRRFWAEKKEAPKASSDSPFETVSIDEVRCPPRLRRGDPAAPLTT